MFRPNALNRLTVNDTFSCIGGLEVTHQTAVPAVPGMTMIYRFV